MIVLASQSAGRLATLRGAGIEPHVRVSDVDEERVLADLTAQAARKGLPQPTARQQVEALALAKAQAVAASLVSRPATSPAPPNEPTAISQASVPAGMPDGAEMIADADRPAGTENSGSAVLVLGCDSMFELDGQVMGKPADAAQARERWLAMRGRTGVLHSGHALVRLSDGQVVTGVSSASVCFGMPTDEEIDAYVASGEPLWCAGAFTIDGLGGAFIDSIEGDPHGVMGLSLPLLRGLVTSLGVRWTDLWNAGRGDAASRPIQGVEHAASATTSASA